MAVSDPESPKYGQSWSQDDVVSAFQPSHDTVQAVSDWLSGHGVTDFTHSDNKQWLAFDIPVRKAQEMFKTRYFERQKRDKRNGGVTFEAFSEHYSLPAHLTEHIDFVKPGIQSSEMTGQTARSRRYLHEITVASSSEGPGSRSHTQNQRHNLALNSTNPATCKEGVTPACIRALYDIPLADPAQAVSSQNTLGVFAATQQLYFQGSLDVFYEKYTNIPAGTSPIFKPIDDPLYPPNSTNGTNSRFAGGEGATDLESALPIIYPQNATVFELSKGYNDNVFNRFVSAIDGSYCTQSQRINSSSGGKPQCGIYKPTKVITFSFNDNENTFSPLWTKRQCTEYLKLGLQGVSVFFASGDYGVDWMGKDPHDICLANGTTGQFSPDFPPSCPWVTAVGGTRIAKNSTTAHLEEAARVYNPFNGGNTTLQLGYSSGGGFSNRFHRPGYQKTAVSHYFKTSNPRWPFYRDGKYENSTGKYNRNGRGYPDIAAIGQNLVLCGVVPGDQFECTSRGGGTSFSTPLIAAIFNRINEERIRVGKTTVGFVNPTLYKNPEAFHDVVKGGNGSPPCLPEDGFECTEGWDPVSGLGTPKYPKLLEIFMNLP